MTSKELIAELKYAQAIHAEWAAWLRGQPIEAIATDPRPLQEIIGSPEWHDRWVNTYDAVLQILELCNE